MSLAELVRRADPDRYFCALFASAERRETLFTLYAFNHELARACEVTREMGLTLIRLQWWREVVEGATKHHEVAAPVRAAIAAGTLEASLLLDMIAAREREAEGGFASVDEWVSWLRQGAGSLMMAAGQALDADTPAAARLCEMGAGYGLAGQSRNVAAFAAQGRCLLPSEACARFGLTPEAVAEAPDAPAVGALMAWLAQTGQRLLGCRSQCGRAWIAAALPVVLARRDLDRPAASARPRSLSDRLAVLQAAFSQIV